MASSNWRSRTSLLICVTGIRTSCRFCTFGAVSQHQSALGLFSTFRLRYGNLTPAKQCESNDPMNNVSLRPSIRLVTFSRQLLAACFISMVALSAASAVSVGQLRCEYLKEPLGIDVLRPRLSWVLGADKGAARGQAQTGYQIVVASNRNELDANQGDIWDSGRIASDQSIQVPYAGKALVSEEECLWKVRVWDEQGKPSPWSEPARWTMGLLRPSDWHAKWIGLDEATGSRTATNVLGDAQWIWFPEGQPEKAAPVGMRCFRRVITLPADRAVKRAILFFTADDSGECYVNGQKAGTAGDFHSATMTDVTTLLHHGDNVLAASVKNGGADPNPAGLIALLRVEFAQGGPLVILTDSNWRAGKDATAGWMDAGFAETGWMAAQKLGPAGMAPWGEITGPEDRRLPARMLRRQFEVEKKVQRATAYVCGLGLYEFYLNGQKVGDQVLSPALTDYSKRALYVTFDMTRLLKKGANVAGVILGNGRFYPPPSTVP